MPVRAARQRKRSRSLFKVIRTDPGWRPATAVRAANGNLVRSGFARAAAATYSFTAPVIADT
ncbi:MAG: hypothetical protein JWP21_601 [Tardiphaga sp.]|nr:hypothetical protein [Tardiphaga sp.]